RKLSDPVVIAFLRRRLAHRELIGRVLRPGFGVGLAPVAGVGPIATVAAAAIASARVARVTGVAGIARVAGISGIAGIAGGAGVAGVVGVARGTGHRAAVGLFQGFRHRGHGLLGPITDQPHGRERDQSYEHYEERVLHHGSPTFLGVNVVHAGSFGIPA